MIFTHKYDILFIFGIVQLLNNCQFIWNNEGYKSELVIMAILTNGHENRSHQVGRNIAIKSNRGITFNSTPICILKKDT